MQVCRGVLALHDRRLVHFDLKPSNVFLKGDAARVGDYGLAKLMGEGLPDALLRARHAALHGAGDVEENRADHRADIYSLGVMLYESLTGRLPYGVEHGGAGVFVREDDEPPPFPPGFPPGLQATVEGCLRLQPADRFASVHELLESIGQAPRPGDSMVLGPWLSGERMGAPPTRQSVAPQARTDGSPRPAEELRTTAAELTRGAVEVARGVLDGVRGRTGAAARTDARASGPSEAVAPAPARSEPLAEAPDVVSVQTLASPEPAPPEPRPNARARSARAQTVPVPPRAEGGLIGTLFATVALGVEVMVSLLTGPVRQGLVGVGRAGDRVMRGVPSACGGVLRLVGFFLLLFVVGALLTFFVVSMVLGLPVTG